MLPPSQIANYTITMSEYLGEKDVGVMESATAAAAALAWRPLCTALRSHSTSAGHGDRTDRCSLLRCQRCITQQLFHRTDAASAWNARRNATRLQRYALALPTFALLVSAEAMHATLDLAGFRTAQPECRPSGVKQVFGLGRESNPFLSCDGMALGSVGQPVYRGPNLYHTHKGGAS